MNNVPDLTNYIWNVKNEIKTIVKMHNLHEGHLHLMAQAKMNIVKMDMLAIVLDNCLQYKFI